MLGELLVLSVWVYQIKTNIVMLAAFGVSTAGKTRKLSYRKDDRAMRPIYGCPEPNCRESLSMPRATFPVFPKIFMGF